jgi:hypothetical protein
MIIRCALVAAPPNRLIVDLPNYTMLPDANTDIRALCDVPDTDVSPDVAAFVAAYPTVDLTTPLPVPFPASLANSWAEFLARRYDLGNAKWHPAVF